MDSHTKYSNVSYFNGLDSLRFFAAYLVMIHHAEVIRLKNGLFSLNNLSLFNNGGNAVSFFFVLSGFLITYLLLKEIKATSTIKVKYFYLKRILRIWPLYFLMVAIGTIFLPIFLSVFNIDYQMPYSFADTWYLFVFFLPDLVTFYYGHHLLEPLWSIGVEELFYLIWAPLSKWFKKNILLLLLAIIFIKVLLLLYLNCFEASELFSRIVNTCKFEAMAVGGLGAYFVFKTKREISHLFVYKKYIQVILYGLLVIFLLFGSNIRNTTWNAIFETPILSALFIYLLYVYLIIGVSLNDKNIFKLKNKTLTYFGQISYGIYMYHMIIIFAIVLFLKNVLFKTSPIIGTLIFYALITAGVLIVSHVSKKYFEDKFLNLRSKFLSSKS